MMGQDHSATYDIWNFSSSLLHDMNQISSVDTIIVIYDEGSKTLDNFFKMTPCYSSRPLSLLSPWHFLTSLASDLLSILWGPLYSLDPGATLYQWSIVTPYGYISQQNIPRDCTVKHPLWVGADGLGSTGKWGMAISQRHALRAGGQPDVCPALGLVSGTGPCRASPEERKGSSGVHLGLSPHPTRTAKRQQAQETRDITAEDRKATWECLIVKTVSDLWSHFPGNQPTFSNSSSSTMWRNVANPVVAHQAGPHFPSCYPVTWVNSHECSQFLEFLVISSNKLTF